MKTHQSLNDPELLLHAIAAAGDESQLAKHLGRSFRTVDVWKTRTSKQNKKLPLGVRPHILLVLDHLLKSGADLATVGDLLGHRAPYRTTARYLAHTNEDRKREVLKRLSTPHRSRRKSVAVRQSK